MKKLLELEARLRKAKEELEKNAMMGYGQADMATENVNIAKEEHEDEKEDKKMIAEALDEHNEKKHGEPKKKNSAYKDLKVKKSDVPKEITDQPTSEILDDASDKGPMEKGCHEMVKFEKNGQWSIK